MRATATRQGLDRPSRRIGRGVAAAFALLAFVAPPAMAQSQPPPGTPPKSAKAAKPAKKPPEPPFATGPMLVVVPAVGGTGADRIARAVARQLHERSGHPATVENRHGAGGTIGAASVAKAEGDGRTMLIVPAGYASRALLQRNPGYDQSRNLAPVSLLASGPLVLALHPSLPVKSVKELIALGTGKAAKLAFGSPGVASLGHLSGELFKSMAGVRMSHVPNKAGSAPEEAVNDKIQVHFLGARQALPLVTAGQLRAIAVTGQQRTPLAPQIPTIAESGVPGYDMIDWHGMMVPATTPPDVISRLGTEVARIVQLADIKGAADAEGLTVVGSTPGYFASFLVRETAKYRRVLQAAGIQGAP